jgi:hypothetical protein
LWNQHRCPHAAALARVELYSSIARSVSQRTADLEHPVELLYPQRFVLPAEVKNPHLSQKDRW